MADYFVICTATSTTQIKAMSDACEEAMEKQGERVHHIEGHRGGTWLLMDFSSVVVHIFMDEARKFYDLERLWGDAEEIPLEDVLKDA
ncbi:MAG: ribosome silencing factor [Oscillospiraceae bacterium]